MMSHVQGAFTGMISTSSGGASTSAITNRADALSRPVRFRFDLIERVTVLADRFLRVDVSDGGGITHRILGWCHKLQMLRVLARPVTAGVVDNHPVGKFAVGREPCDTVSASTRPAQVECSVPVFVEGSGPC